MTDKDKTEIRVPIDSEFRELVERAKRLTGITTNADVARHAITMLVRGLEAPMR